MISEPIATRVNGIEKYLVSLNAVKTFNEKTIPITINAIPGNPR